MISGYLNDINSFILINNEKPVEPPPKLISQYIEGRRVMPSNTPFPGYWENWRSHYAVEIMDSLAPWSPIRNVDLMAAAQVVKSATVENVIAYYMDACPSPILYVSGTDDLLQKWGPKRLEPLIDSIGMRSKLFMQTENKHSRMTGDKANQKLFTGGFLEMASAQSPAGLRADSVKILILEECDSAPRDLTTGEGRWDLVVEARTKAFEMRKKILAVSTPTTLEMSIIFDRFQLGDQREFFVPCPYCKKDQTLTRGSVEGSHGLRASTKAGETEFVYYQCEHCREAIFEHQKNWMIPRGHWEPSATGGRLRRSYHINSLYSPLGMYSWFSYWDDFLTAQRSPDGMRSFTNLQDGLPYKEQGARPKLENVIELRGGYREKTVPDGVLYLTVGVDVQRGSENDPENPARIEFEVLGIGSGYRTFSVLYHRIVGAIDDPHDGAWERFNQFALDGGLCFKRRDGMVFTPQLIFIDSGDGVFSDVVYRFCARWQNTFPSKGFGSIKKKDTKKIEAEGDQIGAGNVKRYRAVKVSDDVTLYEIGTNYYKTITYNNLKILRGPTEPQRPGFCDFPVDRGEKYFRMLTAEEKRSDGSFHAGGRRNEALDTRVYAQCAGDVYLDALVLEYKAAAKLNGAESAHLQQINHRFVIEQLKKRVGVNY